jgi:(p)ppGpp synthase/HD superfamily hydrolase
LGLIHQNFKPKPGTFVDYISVPKVNGYRSLHTCVFGPEGTTLEIQIRTHEMHIENEYGIAACFFQKGDEANQKLMGKDQRAYWAGKIVELQKEQEPDTKFMIDLKEDILGDRIFVFTAAGDSVDLPQGANCIDFAYHLSDEIGHRAVKADINGQILPLNTVLQNGDTVKIISSEIEKGPSRSWLVFVKTSYARNKIKDYFKKISRDYKLQTGLELVQKELTRAGLGLFRDIPKRKMNRFLSSNPEFIDNDDILIAIGEGSLTTLEFINFFYPKNSPTLSNIKFFEKHFSVSKLTEKIYTKVAIKIISKDAVGQLERILKVYSDLKVNVLKTRAYLSPFSGDFICSQILAIESFSQVSKVFENLEQLDGVRVVKRMFWQKNLLFLTGFLFTFGVWALHPSVVYYIVKNNVLDTNMLNIFNYFAISLLFFLVFQLKNLTERSFPELRETKSFWFLAFGIATFAFITIFAEINFFQLELNWVILLGLILIVFSYLIAEYIFYRDRHHS